MNCNMPKMTALLFVALFVGAAASADAVRITSGDVDSLISALAENAGSGKTIELEVGSYLMPEVPSYTNSASSGSGLSSLRVSGVRLIGMGSRPEDVLLVGNGGNRVVYGENNGVLENLTVTNGYAKAFGSSSYANRGGGCFGYITLTNCVVTGCRADGPGGGCQLNVKIRNSRIENNISSNVGGGFHNCYAYDSLIVGNSSVGDGGGVYAGQELVNCMVLSNRTAKKGGGCYNVAYATNCLIANNKSNGNGGGAANNDDASIVGNNKYVDCRFFGNTSENGVGGGAARVTLKDCTVSNNVAKSHGGVSFVAAFDSKISFNRAFSGLGGGVGESVISNCTVYANVCSNRTDTAYGGGIESGSAYDCEIYGNYAMSCVDASGKTQVGSAGGAHGATLYDCYVHDNYADSYGGGIREVTAYRCVISNNFGGNDGRNSYNSNLIDCDVSGSDLQSGSAMNTVIRDIGVFELDNPYKPGLVATNYYVWKKHQNATNCLFRNNMPESATPTFFVGFKTADISTSLVNCTFVSNRYDRLGTYFQNAEKPIHFVNCVFYGNYRKDGTNCDISFYNAASSSRNEPGAIDFDACAYAAASVPQGLEKFVVGGGNLYQFGANGFGADPRFCGERRDASHPYSLRRSSPLIGIGQLFDWMDEATDIRGDGFARKRDGKVDIGCYQCWLDPKGTVFSLR